MIKLHKLFFLFAAVAAFTACSNSEETNGTDDSLLANAPQTEVYMGVDVLNNYQKVNAVTRAANPLSPTANVNYFNVKVDPRLGFNLAPNKYVGVMNNGKVYTDCPYITINKDKRLSSQYKWFGLAHPYCSRRHHHCHHCKETHKMVRSHQSGVAYRGGKEHPCDMVSRQEHGERLAC